MNNLQRPKRAQAIGTKRFAIQGLAIGLFLLVWLVVLAPEPVAGVPEAIWLPTAPWPGGLSPAVASR